VSIATDLLPEMTGTAAWPEFVQCAGSARARAHLKAKLTGIQEAHRTGDPQLWLLIQQYVTSFDARLAATRLAASKMRWYRRPKKGELETIAKGLHAFQGTPEEVRLLLIRKSANTFRPTLDFGIENRALQYLVLSVLYAIAELHPRQFATRGGVPAAIAQVMDAMRAGYVHVREIDIKDFYASFDRNKLVERVPVQKKVIERVLLSEHLNIVPSNLHHIKSCFGAAGTVQGEVAPLEKYLAEARRGIPQGSAASPLLAEMLLAPLLFQVPAGGKVVVVAYADNILVMAKTASDADAMTNSLGLALKKHPAGPLWPKIKSFPAGGPIEFLGHRLTAHGDKVRAQPTTENQEKFERRMKEGLARLRKPTLAPATRRRLARDLESYLSSYVSNFKLCDGVKACQQHWSAQIESAEHKGTTMSKSKPASDNKTKMVFWPHPDQYEIITAALDEEMKKTGSEVKTVALEAICQSYMATGIAFKDWRLALAFDRKGTQDAASFVQKVLMFLEELCPELVIETTIKHAHTPA
jgi:Reverse transcriptase (RNA-dependent DNA polymerase)